nr:immunoglobulin heavy chain junction region [Macaca mulatta]MOW87450.1 immunoglobulin heavy chain junction region [Macaca mulatta]MOW87821.1 immunoglobulin heavy chain junction region [Macaca mulatta]MOW87888.1 immunoglobulin heavy chain junction region [Macaca mulatta]MOW88028.1 immunoglobulin heavy chain junction region [Macaca mulatta]
CARGLNWGVKGYSW